jgi:hypothetical protein
VEGQVGPPGFVHDQRQVALVADPCDAGDVGAGAPVGRRDEQHALGIGMRRQRPAHVLRLRRVRKVALRIEVRVHPHRLHPTDDQSGDYRLVRIAADQQFLARTGDRHDRRLHREGAAARGEERLLRADGVGHELLGLAEDALGLPAVIEAVEGQDIGGEDIATDHLQHPRIGAAALLVARRPEHHVAATTEFLQCLQHRCPRVVHDHGLPRRAQRNQVDPNPAAPRRRQGRFVLGITSARRRLRRHDRHPVDDRHLMAYFFRTGTIDSEELIQAARFEQGLRHRWASRRALLLIGWAHARSLGVLARSGAS